MKNIVQLSPEQSQIITEDLGEIIYLLQNEKGGVLRDLKDIINSVNTINERHIEKILQLEKNQLEIEKTLTKYASQDIDKNFKILRKDLSDSIKNYNYKKIVEEHGETLADAFRSSIEDNQDFKKMIKTALEFNAESAFNIDSKFKMLKNTLYKSVDKLSGASSAMGVLRYSCESTDLKLKNFNKQLINSLSWKVKFVHGFFGFILGGASIFVLFKYLI